MLRVEQPRLRVRVWFGTHAIADYCAERELAERYAAAMRRRFPGLRVTSDPLPHQRSSPPPADRP